MAASKKVRIDADTSGISAALSRVNNAGKDVGKSLGGAVPMLSRMNIAALAVSATIGTVVTGARQWAENIRRGNEEQEKAVKTARELAAATGDFGDVSAFASHAEFVAGRGTLGRDALLGAAGAFRGGAPAATARATRTAMAHAQTAGTTGQDVNRVSQIAGQLLQIGVINTGNEDDDIALAFDYGGFLIANLGDDASRAAEVLPRLIASGLSLDDAMGVYMGLRGMGRQARSQAISALQQAHRIRGIEGARRVIGRHEMFRGELGQRAVAGMETAEGVGGFQARAMADMAADPVIRQQMRIEMIRNRQEAERREARDMDRAEWEAAQAYRREGRVDPFGRPIDWARRLVGAPGGRTRGVIEDVDRTIVTMSRYTPQE